MRKIFLTSVLSTILASIVFVTPANAHVLIMDTTDKLGLVLHVTPADEPVAGKISNLYFDIQNSAANIDTSKAILDISSIDTSDSSVPLEKHTNSLNAAYLFNKPGVYTLVLTVISNGKTYLFSHSLRVAANDQVDNSAVKNSSWAKATIVVSTTAILVLLIIAFNRRKRIASQSR